MDPLLTDAGHFDQPFGLAVNDLQRLHAEMGDNAFGRHRADAFDQAAAQVLFDPGDGGRQHAAHLFHRKLFAVFWVNRPLPA